MLFLSPEEIRRWRDTAAEVCARRLGPDACAFPGTRLSLRAHFHFYVGGLLGAEGDVEGARRWFVSGEPFEDERLPTNRVLADFLKRYGKFSAPGVIFADPRAYAPFSVSRPIRKARARFLDCVHSVPASADRPFSFLDIGCGDGVLTAAFLARLLARGTVGRFDRVVLLDSSAGMLAKAVPTVAAVLGSDHAIVPLHARVQDAAASLEGGFDLTLSALAYHHMPVEDKRRHLRELGEKTRQMIVFELDANNDRGEQGDPALAVSVYQTYGRLFDFVLTGSDDEARFKQACLDGFTVAETISFFVQPRAERTDFHMLRTEWHELFREAWSGRAACLYDASSYADEFTSLFTLHYGNGLRT